jgi:chemosensory pili system protein ChpA (sensor histidine kinase/response regulator)
MTDSAQFDRNTLATVKPGMDGSLAEISAKLELFLGAPAENEAALEAVRTELHRLLGVLKMVGLDGAAVFCAELELTLSELATSPKQVSAMHRDVLRRALFAVTHYLDTLSKGADNAALRLFPQYQELQQLRGLEMSFELDLFYPNLDVELPKQVLDLPVQSDAMGRLKMLRSQYQQALLKWLRQEEDAAESVQLMQQAMDGALRCAPQDGSRAFWWIAYGLLDCLKLDGIPPEMNVRKLLGRIDQHMRAVVEGNVGDVSPVMNEMLYLIGYSHAVSEPVDEIKRIYSLDQYLPELSALSPGEIDQMLGHMRNQLRAAEDSWELCAQGEGSACEKFISYVDELASQSDKLDRDVLQYLSKQIQTLSQYATSPEHARPIAMDMAMALLLLGSGIENYRRIGANFQEQARILSERMQAAVKQQPEDTKRLSELVDLHYQMEQRGDVMGPLANEMLVNLQHVEQGLNAFFNNAIKRDELTELLRLLNQIQGGLRISSLQHAEQLLASIQDHVDRFTKRDESPKPAERYALADAMSALENYMQYLTHGQAGDVSRLKAALVEMVKLDQTPKPATVVPLEPPKATMPKEAPTVKPTLATEPLNFAPPEPPKAAMPKEAPPAKPTLATEPLNFARLEPLPVSEPAATTPTERPKFSEPATIAGYPKIPEPLPATPAGKDMGSIDFVPVEPSPVAPVENIPTESAKPPPVTTVSDEDQELLDIFLEEAREVLGSIRSNLETCQLHPDSHELLVTIRRGFHTLKGSGRMVGLTDLGEIAWCVERAMNKWLQEKKSATPGLLSLINAAVQSFSGWVDTLGNRGKLIIEAEDLIAAAQQIENGQDSEVRLDVSAAGEKPASSSADHGQVLEAPVAEQVPASAATPTPVPAEMPAASGEAVPPSPALFNIASAELKQNIAVLHQQLDALRMSVPPVVQYDFMRAAHTLAGVCRTMGFSAVVELAFALEGWLKARLEKPFTVSGMQRQLLDQTIVVLDGMIQSICNEEVPQTRGDLVNQLLADKDNLNEAENEQVSGDVIELKLDVLPDAKFSTELQVDTDTTRHRDDEDVLKLAGENDFGLESNLDETIIEKPASKPELVTRPEGFASAVQPDDTDKAGNHDNLKESLLIDIDGEKQKATVAEQGGATENLLQPFVVTVAKPTEGQTEPEKPRVYDDVDEQLLPVFLEEAEDLCPKISEALRAWREPPHDEHQLALLKRLLHTMKGSSRMVGAMRIGEIAHEMEDRVLAAAGLSYEAEYLDSLESDFDRIMALLEELRGGKSAEEAKPVPMGRRSTDQPAGVERRADRRAQEPGAALGNMLRVRSDVVDRLVNEAGEINVARSRVESEIGVLKDSLLELTASVMRLRQQLREVEIQAESQMQARVSLAKDNAEQFDPLEFDRFTRLQELTRFMNESVHDVQTVQQSMLKNLEETAVVMMSQGRLNRELQQGLMNVRMVSFNSITDRLYRIVRQTGKELNKRANLELQGTNVELDRSVLEKMIAPFEHLLRNSIVHGLENEQQRAQNGKLPIGEIRLSVRQESNEVVFEFGDDGAGLNFTRLREKAIANGSLQADEEVSDDQLAQLIFTPGLSTATEITEIAGRGIGMDVVRSEIAGLGGRIDVSSKRGEGTRFIIHLPLTLAVTQVLMIRSGDQIYAIPSTMVEQVRQEKPEEMDALYRERQIDWQGNTYMLHYLPHLLGDTEIARENQPRNPVLLLSSGAQHIALNVDELLGNQEVMVKNIGPQLARLSGIAGATVLGDGNVVLILNPVQLAQRIGGIGKIKKATTSIKTPNTEPLIMVVDDSLTVRKITSRMLIRAGYQVVTATDGVDALEKLEECTPDVMLLDIEMPRMDGFALARELRRDPKTQDLPIIMITSRTADKHRDYAMQLGVNTYLGKPYQEDELLQNIADFVAVHKLDA